MHLSNLSRQRVIDILSEYGYKSSGEIEPDNYEKFSHSKGYPDIFLGNAYIKSNAYPIAYDYKYEGCENGIRSYIMGAYSDEEEF